MTDKDAIFQDVQQLGITRPGQIYANLSATRKPTCVLTSASGSVAIASSPSIEARLSHSG